MNLVDHARRELELCGQFAEDPAYAQSILAAVAAFSSFGHSGGSAGIAIEQLSTVLKYGNLSPLTDDPAEWHHHPGDTWQSTRRPDAFSDDGGKTYKLLDDPLDDLGGRPRYESAPARKGAEA